LSTAEIVSFSLNFPMFTAFKMIALLFSVAHV